MNRLCKTHGHAWDTVKADCLQRSCAYCGARQHRAPGGPWVDYKPRRNSDAYTDAKKLAEWNAL